MKSLLVFSSCACFALSPLAKAETMHSSDGFVTSSGNIQCSQSDPKQTGSADTVLCIRENPSLLIAYIENGKVITTTKRTFDIAVESVPTLKDGSKNVFAGSECMVTKHGVTCKQGKTAFMISRKGVEILK